MSPMNNRLLVPRKTPGLLDLVPGAAAAYSLRSLSDSYAGPVVTVRRSSDDAEEDFTAAEVADGTLAAFCGAGDGFVKQWWDQSGNARHAIQTTTTYQPKIVSSGVVITEEGKPAIEFDGTNDWLASSYLPAFGAASSARFGLFAVATTSDLTANRRLVSSQAAGFIFHVRVTSSSQWQAALTDSNGVADSAYYAATTQQALVATQYDGVANNLYLDAVARASTTANYTGSFNAGAPFLIGGYGTAGVDQWQGTMQEVILYPSDFSSQRELIEGNIAFGWS